MLKIDRSTERIVFIAIIVILSFWILLSTRVKEVKIIKVTEWIKTEERKNVDVEHTKITSPDGTITEKTKVSDKTKTTSAEKNKILKSEKKTPASKNIIASVQYFPNTGTFMAGCGATILDIIDIQITHPIAVNTFSPGILISVRF